MNKIESKIVIQERVLASKTSFQNNQIGSLVRTDFTYNNCCCTNQIEIVPYETGYPFFNLYENNTVLSTKEILYKKVATVTDPWAADHLGELTVDNLPTLYLGIECIQCNAKYLVVFGYGEKRPGVVILEISGIWKYS